MKKSPPWGRQEARYHPTSASLGETALSGFPSRPGKPASWEATSPPLPPRFHHPQLSMGSLSGSLFPGFPGRIIGHG